MLNLGIWHWFTIILLLFFTTGIITGKASQVLRKIICQFQKEVCPYCFDYFWLHETPFRCTSPMARCTPMKDTVLEKVWGDTRPVGKVLSSTGRFSSSAICIDCGQQSHKRLCPHCHMELPHTTGQFKNYIFSVIGAKNSGKSHYLAVLINQIRKRLGPDMNILLEPMNDDTIKRYRKDFYEPIYHDKRVIFGTTSALTNRKVRQPLVYSLSISGKGILRKNKIKKAVILVFFDTAGEDLNDEDVMSTVNKYIYRSDGILLLIDPLQLPAVRDKVAPTTPLPQINTETADILNRTTRLIERGHSMQPTDVIKIPLAVAFSKFDAVLPLLDPHSQLHASANHDGGFDIDDFEAVNVEMMTRLDKWNGQDILQLARTRYKRYGFFGLTALGCNPHDSKKISRLLPRRIEDPFLWLLAQNNIIRKVRRK